MAGLPNIVEPRLSPRQRECSARWLAGMSTEEIAADLELSTSTVRTHMAATLDKLGLHCRRELLQVAVRKGWFGKPDPPPPRPPPPDPEPEDPGLSTLARAYLESFDARLRSNDPRTVATHRLVRAALLADAGLPDRPFDL